MFNFDKIVEERCRNIKETLNKKKKEYASSSNCFHNFFKAAQKLDCTPETALMGMKAKHDVSVDDLVALAAFFPTTLDKEIINEKINDSICYLILLEGLLKQRLAKIKQESNNYADNKRESL